MVYNLRIWSSGDNLANFPRGHFSKRAPISQSWVVTGSPHRWHQIGQGENNRRACPPYHGRTWAQPEGISHIQGQCHPCVGSKGRKIPRKLIANIPIHSKNQTTWEKMGFAGFSCCLNLQKGIPHGHGPYQTMSKAIHSRCNHYKYPRQVSN